MDNKKSFTIEASLYLQVLVIIILLLNGTLFPLLYVLSAATLIARLNIDKVLGERLLWYIGMTVSLLGGGIALLFIGALILGSIFV